MGSSQHNLRSAKSYPNLPEKRRAKRNDPPSTRGENLKGSSNILEKLPLITTTRNKTDPPTISQSRRQSEDSSTSLEFESHLNINTNLDNNNTQNRYRQEREHSSNYIHKSSVEIVLSDIYFLINGKNKNLQDTINDIAQYIYSFRNNPNQL